MRGLADRVYDEAIRYYNPYSPAPAGYPLLVIGQAPGPSTDPERPLAPDSETGRRLLELTGLCENRYYLYIEPMNLLRRHPGRTRLRDDTWPRAEARLAAEAVTRFLECRHVVLLGRNVARVFGLGDAPWHRWRCVDIPEMMDGLTRGCFDVAVTPHPSGRNHYYNRPENRRAARRFWQKAIERIK